MVFGRRQTREEFIAPSTHHVAFHEAKRAKAAQAAADKEAKAAKAALKVAQDREKEAQRQRRALAKAIADELEGRFGNDS